jgi:hypothetical protein
VWDFAGRVLDSSGAVAALLFVAICTMAAVVGVLWRKTEKLHDQAMQAIAAATTSIQGHADTTTSLLKSHADDMRRLSEQRVDELKALAATHAAAVATMATDQSKQLTTLASRIDELQERRIREAADLTERVLVHIKNIDRFAAQLEATVDVVLRRR